jgi:hypothetical protein
MREIQFESAPQIVDGAVMAALGFVRTTTVPLGHRKFRIDRDHLRVVGDSAVGIFLGLVRVAAPVRKGIETALGT